MLLNSTTVIIFDSAILELFCNITMSIYVIAIPLDWGCKLLKISDLIARIIYKTYRFYFGIQEDHVITKTIHGYTHM